MIARRPPQVTQGAVLGLSAWSPAAGKRARCASACRGAAGPGRTARGRVALRGPQHGRLAALGAPDHAEVAVPATRARAPLAAHVEALAEKQRLARGCACHAAQFARLPQPPVQERSQSWQAAAWIERLACPLGMRGRAERAGCSATLQRSSAGPPRSAAWLETSTARGRRCHALRCGAGGLDGGAAGP